MSCPVDGSSCVSTINIHHIVSVLGTCVIEHSVLDGAVFEEGVGWLDVLKVAVLKQRILELHRLNLYVCKSEWREINEMKQ